MRRLIWLVKEKPCESRIFMSIPRKQYRQNESRESSMMVEQRQSLFHRNQLFGKGNIHERREISFEMKRCGVFISIRCWSSKLRLNNNLSSHPPDDILRILASALI
jgi:hypothetical protein